MVFRLLVLLLFIVNLSFCDRVKDVIGLHFLSQSSGKDFGKYDVSVLDEIDGLRNYLISKLQVIDNCIFYSKPLNGFEEFRLRMIKRSFNKNFHKRKNSPNLLAVFSSNDGFPVIENNATIYSIPVLHMNGINTSRKLDYLYGNTFLLPDAYSIANDYGDMIKGDFVNWHARDNRIYWRGATTGGYYNFETYKDMVRYKLVDLSSKHPNIIDAKFTSTPQCNASLAQQLKQRSLLGPYENLEHKVVQYKYGICLDGNVSAWGRAIQLMLGGTVLFLQQGWKCWYYDALEPWVHYVPVKDDLSDLVANYKRLESDPALAYKIARSGYKFAREYLSQHNVMDHLVYSLEQYSKLGFLRKESSVYQGFAGYPVKRGELFDVKHSYEVYKIILQGGWHTYKYWYRDKKSFIDDKYGVWSSGLRSVIGIPLDFVANSIELEVFSFAKDHAIDVYYAGKVIHSISFSKDYESKRVVLDITSLSSDISSSRLLKLEFVSNKVYDYKYLCTNKLFARFVRFISLLRKRMDFGNKQVGFMLTSIKVR